ncbi:hypothetical protein SDJN02_15391, partial [Cucurbita argyrosperma subsp. argyrosperma]
MVDQRGVLLSDINLSDLNSPVLSPIQIIGGLAKWPFGFSKGRVTYNPCGGGVCAFSVVRMG